jgi:hypothetical protein
MSAPAPLKNFVRTPKKSFATQSGAKRTSRRERGQCVDRHDLKDEAWEFA